jgi:hypothetical protein
LCFNKPGVYHIGLNQIYMYTGEYLSLTQGVYIIITILFASD